MVPRQDASRLHNATPCPECGYKVSPNEMMRLDFERMRCPSCCKDVVIQNKSSGGTAAPMEHKKVAVASPKCV